jgi:HK97 family phage portal protein
MSKARDPLHMSYEDCARSCAAATKRREAEERLSQRPQQGALDFPSGEPEPDWPTWILNHPFLPAGYLESYRDAFRNVPIVAAAISQIQHDVASLPIRVWQGTGPGRKEVERQKGNLVDVLKGANSLQTGYELMASLVGSLFIAGNGYLYVDTFGTRQSTAALPWELWLLAAHRMIVVAGEDRGMREYRYLRGGVETRPAGNIIHLRDYTPDDEPTGMSRLEPVRRQWEGAYYANIWLKEFYRKGGMASGIFNIPSAAKGGPNRQYTDKELRAMMRRLENLHQGYDKAWRPVVMQGLEWIQRGFSLTDMEIESTLGLINAEVCRALGVPPWRLGIKEGSNLGQSGASVDEQIYWTGTIMRVTSLIAATLNERLAPLFGPDLEIEFDFSRIAAVQSITLDQARALVMMAGGPILSVNEARDVRKMSETGNPEDDEIRKNIAPPLGEPKPGRPGTEGHEDVPVEKPKASEARFARALKASNLRATEKHAALRKDAAVNLARYEGEMAAYWRRTFAAQREPVKAWAARYVKAHTASSASRLAAFAVEPGDIPIELPKTDAELSALLHALIARRGEEAAAEVVANLIINMRNDRAAAFVTAQTRRLWDDVTGTTTEKMREIVATGLQQGEGLVPILERVDAFFDYCEGERSLLIARTETNRAYNFASVEGWRQTEVVDRKEWLTAEDGAGGRHAEDPIYTGLDGQVVDLDEAFDVGGEPLQFPGDPGGPAGETCNCRCTLLPVVNEAAMEGLSRARWAKFWRGSKGETNGAVHEGVEVGA